MYDIRFYFFSFILIYSQRRTLVRLNSLKDYYRKKFCVHKPWYGYERCCEEKKKKIKAIPIGVEHKMSLAQNVRLRGSLLEFKASVKYVS